MMNKVVYIIYVREMATLSAV